MDVVYVLGSGSQWQNNELRYSLRSLRNIQHNNVFIVGDCPEWVENVTHIPAIDYSNIPQINVADKLLIVANDERISEDFILMNDDFFILKPTEIRPYYKQTLEQAKEMYKYNDHNYAIAVRNTHALYPFGLDYSLHIPFIFNRKKLATTTLHLGALPLLLRSVYANQWQIGGEIMEDCKVSEVSILEEYDGTFMSINDSVAKKPELQAFLMDRFPCPSRYERC